MRHYYAGAPFERIAMDVAGSFPLRKLGTKYVLVVKDFFSKWAKVYPIPNLEALKVGGIYLQLGLKIRCSYITAL